MVAATTHTAVMAVLAADPGMDERDREAVAAILESGRRAQISRRAAIEMLGTSKRTFQRKVFETAEWELDVDFASDNASFCYLAQVQALKEGREVPSAEELGVKPRAMPALRLRRRR